MHFQGLKKKRKTFGADGILLKSTDRFASSHNPWGFTANLCLNGTFTRSYKAALCVTVWSGYASQLCE